MRQSQEYVSPRSNEGRNSYVIEQLTKTFLELLVEKPINSISISELVEKAHVGRASFYRNYKCKEDILKSYIDTLFHEWIDEYNENPDMPLNKLIYTMFFKV